MSLSHDDVLRLLTIIDGKFKAKGFGTFTPIVTHINEVFNPFVTFKPPNTFVVNHHVTAIHQCTSDLLDAAASWGCYRMYTIRRAEQSRILPNSSDPAVLFPYKSSRWSWMRDVAS